MVGRLPFRTRSVDIRARDFVERFFRYLETERQVSPHTVSSYRHEVGALVQFCDAYGITSWPAVGVGHVRSFAARSHAKGLSPQSVQRRLSAVRSFFTFLIREGVIGGNHAKLVQAPRTHRKLPQVPDPDQMARLLSIRGNDALTVRDRAGMELLYSSALRLIELILLNCSDLDIADRTVTVLGKGNRTRIVPVGKYAIKALTDWLRHRNKVAKQNEGALFVGRNGRRFCSRNVQLRIAHWARQQGILVHVHPHLFRHSCATHILESCGDIRAVQELLGHASISTTAIYTQLNVQHLAAVYERTHPRAKLKRGSNDGQLLRDPGGDDFKALRSRYSDGSALEAWRIPDAENRSHDSRR